MASTAVARRPASVPRAPSGGTRTTRYRAAAAALARRGGRAALLAAQSEKHTIAALGTAAALGYVQRTGTQIPHIDALGVDGSVGVALWLGGRFTKNRTMQHMATGALACAIKGAVVSGALAPSGTGTQQQQQQRTTGDGGAPRGVMGGSL